MEQPAYLEDEGGLDRLGVNVVAKILHVGLETFIEILWWGIVSHQDADIHVIHQVVGVEALKVLADSRIRLP